ncbi:Ferric cupric reductase transmembrane component 2 protein [Rutstroemia sp. NJR-2017a BBW]|nr:Ferric cupric reductase transmembrane component 2 protein [Rutstroemia sp. NJR-2017a BBW]
MIPSGYGIAAHLAMLKRLVFDYNAREVRARRIRLVWNIKDIGPRIGGLYDIVKNEFNRALAEDEKMVDGRVRIVSNNRDLTNFIRFSKYQSIRLGHNLIYQTTSIPLVVVGTPTMYH